ncbi:MAG: GNAT family N-acetyltransferase [Aerococcaceae bacterium]|nr:GNAT family N-acetyltransferase [Aerococcaceae bacterium]
MQLDIEIRPATPEDAADLLALLAQVHAETPFLKMEQLTLEQERALIETYARSAKSLLLLVHANDQLIGMGNLIEKNETTAELGVCFLKAYWGMGLGRLLVETLIEDAQHLALETLHIEVVKDNQRAIQLYQKCGFEQTAQTNATYYMHRHIQKK